MNCGEYLRQRDRHRTVTQCPTMCVYLYRILTLLLGITISVADRPSPKPIDIPKSIRRRTVTKPTDIPNLLADSLSPKPIDIPKSICRPSVNVADRHIEFRLLTVWHRNRPLSEDYKKKS